MLLLNIADIHFQHPFCGNPDHDPDRPFRTALVSDVKRRVREIGNVDAIIVVGDIAFGARADEYEAANEFLELLSDAANCPLSRVFVVPGNHDVDRRISPNNPATKNAQDAIKLAPDNKREKVLATQFFNAETARSLLKPIEQYNQFAARFDCQVYGPDPERKGKPRLYWNQVLPINGEIKLRFFGLTSTLLSGMDNKSDVRQGLYLSPMQTVLEPLDGVVNAVICHHPPDWLLDIDDIEDSICGRASLHFFGHKHRQRVHCDLNYVRFSAGAVNPERTSGAWEPGYNLIKLSVASDGDRRFLDVEAQLLVWQTNPDMFRPKKVSQSSEVLKHRVEIRWTATAAPADSITSIVTIAPAIRTEEQAEVAVEVVMSTQDTRNLILRFWNLDQSDRRDVALALELISQEELVLPEHERYGRAIERAVQRGILEKLLVEIEKRERQ